jgi:hypothetical protein
MMRSGMGSTCTVMPYGSLALRQRAKANTRVLSHVLDHGKTACHVAIQGAITRGHLALVAGGQHDGAGLVGQGHEQACRGCGPGCFLRSCLLFRPTNKLGPAPCLKPFEHRRDGDLVIAHAQALAPCRGRIDPGNVGRVGRGHHHRVRTLSAPSASTAMARHQGRIDAARQADDGTRETVLAQVVTHAENQGRPRARRLRWPWAPRPRAQRAHCPHPMSQTARCTVSVAASRKPSARARPLGLGRSGQTSAPSNTTSSWPPTKWA